MKIINIFLILLLLQGCSSNDSQRGSEIHSGSFIDSPVEGVEYQTSTQSGITDVGGVYSYYTGESVSFNLGNISLGSAEASEVITPFHLFSRSQDYNSGLNLVRFLLTLDTDLNPINGITISEEQRLSAESLDDLDFSLNPIEFSQSTELLNALIALNMNSDVVPLLLVEKDVAIKHVNQSIANLFSGLFSLVDSVGAQQYQLLLQPDGMAYILDKDGTQIFTEHLSFSFDDGYQINHVDSKFHASSNSISRLDGVFTDNTNSEIYFSATRISDAQYSFDNETLGPFVKEYQLQLQGETSNYSGQLVFSVNGQGIVRGTFINDNQAIAVFGVVSSQGNGLGLDMLIAGERLSIQLDSSAKIDQLTYTASPQKLSGIDRLSVVSQKLSPEGYTVYENTNVTAIPDDGSVEITVDAAYTGTVDLFTVTVDISHEYIGDLLVTLISPTNKTHVLHDESGSGTNINISRKDLLVIPLAYEVGTWTLRVADGYSWDTGNIDYFALEINPDAAPEIDVSSTLNFTDQDLTLGAQTQTLTINNTGNVDLNISNISISGTDFVISQGAGAQVIVAGGSHAIDVDFDPDTLGLKNATITILSDDADEGTKLIDVAGTGVLVPEIEVTPLLINFSSRDIGDSASTSQLVTINNIGSASLEISNISLSSGAAHFNLVSGGGAQSIASGSSHQVAVAFDPSAVGLQSGILQILSDDIDESSVDVNLSGTGTAVGDIQFSLNSLDFSSQIITAGATSSQTVNILNVGSATLNVNSMAIGDQFLVISGSGSNFSIAPGGSHAVAIAFDPDVDGAVNQTLVVNSDDMDEPSLAVSLTGNGVLAQEIQLDVSSLNFNSQDIGAGATASQNIQIQNLGGSDLAISNISLVSGNSEFLIFSGSGAQTVVGGGTHTVQVRFDPTSTGIQNGLLRILSNDASQPIVDVSLVGSGYDGIPEPELDASTVSMSFPDHAVSIGASAIQSMTLINTGSAVLNISNISIDNPEFVIVNGGAISSLAVGGSHQIDITFEPSAVGSRTATLRINSDDLDEGIKLISLTGNGTLAIPDIQASTGTLVFSEQDPAAGSGTALTVVISNLGNAPLQINSVVTSDPVFIIQSGDDAGAIAVGASRVVQLAFDPIALGIVTGNLIISSDDPDQAILNIGLSGEGKDPYVSLWGINYQDSSIGKAIEEYAASKGWGSAAEVKGFVCLICNMTDSSIEDLANFFPNLYSLQFAKGNVTTVAPLSVLSGLRELSIANVDTLNVVTVNGLSSLKNLNLSSMAITDVSGLNGLTGLVNLTLNHNEIVDISALSSLAALNTLVLSDNKVTSLQPLSGLSNLQMLWVMDNNVDCSGAGSLSALQSQLPMTFVFGDMCP